MAQGTRVGRVTKAVTLRLSSDVLEKARGAKLERHVAQILDLDRASLTDILRLAVSRGLEDLVDEIGLPPDSPMNFTIDGPDPELTKEVRRVVLPLLREEIAAVYKKLGRTAVAPSKSARGKAMAEHDQPAEEWSAAHPRPPSVREVRSSKKKKR